LGGEHNEAEEEGRERDKNYRLVVELEVDTQYRDNEWTCGQ
jgi:hypothetical protein